VDAYLVEIAKGYSLPWRPANENAEEGVRRLLPGLRSTFSPCNNWLTLVLLQVPEAAATALGDEKSSATTDPEEAKAKSESHSATEDKPVPPAEEAPVDAFEALKKRFDALKKR
jgi:vacuolar protein sorting-associated protein IST1